MSRQRDAELDRLRSARESAHQRQQAVWQAQQVAYADQQAAWETYASVKRASGPRIDSLNTQQERAYQNMKSAFESASLAHDMHDGASARMYADQGHAYKAESQTCIAERRQLVAEIRAARERFDAVRPAFQAAKSELLVRGRHFSLPRQSTNERRRTSSAPSLNLTRVPGVQG